MPDFLGVPPVHPIALVAGKAGVIVSCSVLILRFIGVDLLGVTADRMRLPAALAAIAGILILLTALLRLGRSVRVGLPVEATTLRTTGVYALSRNPMYVSGFLVCLASCAYVPHWLNLGCTLLAGFVHYRIVLSEERFLDQRFGDAWRAYRSRVRRYL